MRTTLPSPLPPPPRPLLPSHPLSFNRTARLEFDWYVSLGQWAWHVYSRETSATVITARLAFKTKGLRGNVRLWMSTLCVSLFIYLFIFLSIYNFVCHVSICLVWHIPLLIRGKRGNDLEICKTSVTKWITCSCVSLAWPNFCPSIWLQFLCIWTPIFSPWRHEKTKGHTPHSY